MAAEAGEWVDNQYTSFNLVCRDWIHTLSLDHYVKDVEKVFLEFKHDFLAFVDPENKKIDPLYFKSHDATNLFIKLFREDYKDYVSLLIDLGYPVNPIVTEGDEEEKNFERGPKVVHGVLGSVAQLRSQGASDIFEAVKWKDNDRLLEFILGGADVNMPDTDGRTPLELAQTHNRLNAVKILVAAGAKTDKYSPPLAPNEDSAIILQIMCLNGMKLDDPKNRAGVRIVTRNSRVSEKYVKVLIYFGFPREHLNFISNRELAESFSFSPEENAAMDRELKALTDEIFSDLSPHLKQ